MGLKLELANYKETYKPLIEAERYEQLPLWLQELLCEVGTPEALDNLYLSSEELAKKLNQARRLSFFKRNARKYPKEIAEGRESLYQKRKINL